jgi:hypothetical protein
MKLVQLHASRRSFLGKAASAGTMLGTELLCPRAAHAHGGNHPNPRSPNPIPGGVAPLSPFGVFIHHYPLNPANPLSALNDPSQITDFQGFVGLTHFRGGGTGTNTLTGATMTLAFQADMGFNKGEFIAADGFQYRGTFAFV